MWAVGKGAAMTARRQKDVFNNWIMRPNGPNAGFLLSPFSSA